MTDRLDLEAIKRQVREGECPPGEFFDVLVKEIERRHALTEGDPCTIYHEAAALISEVERKDEVISRAMRLCEQERASMTLNVLREALSESPTETKGENG